MNLLLDTHVLLWCLGDMRALSRPVRAAVADSSNLVLVSAATVWEISIKRALGKLEAPGDLRGALAKSAFGELSISAAHAEAAGNLPRHHDDPFDRMLVAQASLEDLVLVTHDAALRRYGVRILTA